MPPKQRHRYILRILEEQELSKEELAQMCGVSVRTIHRDFAQLQGGPEYAWLEPRTVWKVRRMKLAL